MKQQARIQSKQFRVTIRIAGLLAALALALNAAKTPAHHAFSSVFDPQQPLSLEGTVTKVEWTNPHTWFYVDVESESGATENWGFEMGSPNTLARRGINARGSG